MESYLMPEFSCFNQVFHTTARLFSTQSKIFADTLKNKTKRFFKKLQTYQAPEAHVYKS
jgi:hypothetical protein